MTTTPEPPPPAPSSAPAAIPPVVGPGLQLAAPDVTVQTGKTERQSRLEVRIWCTFVFVICAAMFGLAGFLTPKQGLHQKFGMPECGMLVTTGIPCPTCGCTTSVTYFAHGHPIASLLTQPFGFAVALLGFLLLPLTAWGIVTGKWKGPSMWYLGWHWQYWVYGGVAVLLLAWVYRIILVKNHLEW